MNIAGFRKRLNTVIIAVTAILTVLLVALSLAACDRDIKYNDAIKIAQKKFGCDKVLWIESTIALVLQEGHGDGDMIYRMRSHYTYYVVGEKDGEEIYIAIPSDPTLEDAYETTWGLSYSFKEIVERFNEHGAGYVADVPNDYYAAGGHSCFIQLRSAVNLNGLSEYYEMDCDDEEFYERLDIKAFFEYTWEEDGYLCRVIVAQENGALTSYERKTALQYEKAHNRIING